MSASPSYRRAAYPLPLPVHRIDLPSSLPPKPARSSFLGLPLPFLPSPSSASVYIRTSIRRRPWLLLLALVSLVLLLQSPAVQVWRRDLGYILRPIWDSPEPPFELLPHYPPPAPLGPSKGFASLQALNQPDKQRWCALHGTGWRARTGGVKPIIVDTTLLSSELDMLEIRFREYAGWVDVFVIIEGERDFSGALKPLYFTDEVRARFDRLAAEGGATIVYRVISEGLQPGTAKGSFENEVKTRVGLSNLLQELRNEGRIPDGSLILQSDVDEIISSSTLGLLSACSGYPEEMHLQVDNYRYSFAFPLHDGGYWRPHVSTVVGAGSVRHTHGRVGNTMLAGAGWHCSFCFPTLEGMRAKMRGYSHNDRMRGAGGLGEKELRARVCRGQDPFAMWPEAFSFRELIAQSGSRTPQVDYQNLPLALAEDPDRFGYLLGESCSRPDH